MPAVTELPYVEMLLEGVRRGDPEVTTAFGRHMHWGYWGPADRADGTSSDFAVAAERLTCRVCDAARITDGQRILDAGCGRGGAVQSIEERFSGVTLTGLNIDPRQLELGRAAIRPRPGNSVALVEGDACAMPFPDTSFDVVLAVECIFHFPSRARFFAEARRVLRPGGRLALCDFVPAEPLGPLLRLQHRLLGGLVEARYGPTDAACTLGGYRRLAEEAGFACEHAEDITRGTLPTYPVVRRLIRRLGDVPAAAPRLATTGAARAVGEEARLLELASRARLLRYMILAWTRA
jgi:SAM-dependent methyltransferase